MDADLKHILSEYLAAHNALTLATVGPEGPAAAGLFYVSDSRLRLYFLSASHAQHVQNLKHDASVAVAIHEDYRDWRQIQGIQVRGEAHVIESPLEYARAMERYVRKFSFIREFVSDPRQAGEILSQKIALSAFHVIVPHWIRWIDNRTGFSFRREYDMLSNTEIPRER